MKKEVTEAKEEKKHTVSEEDYKFLQRMKVISKEDKQRLRLLSIESNNRKIIQKQREIDFKRDQIENGVSLEKHTDFVDEKKPLWYLENEKETIEAQIEQLEEEKKYAKEEYDKEEKNAT